MSSLKSRATLDVLSVRGLQVARKCFDTDLGLQRIPVCSASPSPLRRLPWRRSRRTRRTMYAWDRARRNRDNRSPRAGSCSQASLRLSARLARSGVRSALSVRPAARTMVIGTNSFSVGHRKHLAWVNIADTSRSAAPFFSKRTLPFPDHTPGTDLPYRLVGSSHSCFRERGSRFRERRKRECA